MIQERRQHQRIIPDPPPSVALGGSQYGNIFDLSEGGIGVDCVPLENKDEIINLEFNLPGSGHIEARAEVAWASEAQRRTGLQFVDLTDLSRQQLRDWIAARAFDLPSSSTTKRAATQSTLFDEPIVNLIEDPAKQERENDVAEWPSVFAVLDRPLGAPTEPERTTSTGVAGLHGFRHKIGFALALVVFVPTFIFLGHLLGNRGYNPLAKGLPPVAHETIPVNGRAGASPDLLPVARTSPAATLSYDSAGFVLQVGAMNQEKNADALREALERKAFPAFVFRHSNGHLYRVAVGPFADPDTAGKIKDKLKLEGFEAILERWLPE